MAKKLLRATPAPKTPTIQTLVVGTPEETDATLAAMNYESKILGEIIERMQKLSGFGLSQLAGYIIFEAATAIGEARVEPSHHEATSQLKTYPLPNAVSMTPASNPFAAFCAIIQVQCGGSELMDTGKRFRMFREKLAPLEDAHQRRVRKADEDFAKEYNRLRTGVFKKDRLIAHAMGYDRRDAKGIRQVQEEEASLPQGGTALRLWGTLVLSSPDYKLCKWFNVPVPAYKASNGGITVTALLDPSETRIGFAAVAKRLGKIRAERPLHPSTPLRWATKGVRLPDGTRLRLRATKTPGGWLTTETWLDDFLTAYTAASLPADDAVTLAVRTPTQRRKASEAAERELTALGI